MAAGQEPAQLLVDWRNRPNNGTSDALSSPGGVVAIVAGCDCCCYVDGTSQMLSIHVNPRCRLHGSMPENVYHFN